MSFTFIPSTAQHMTEELAILNSNPYYNRLNKGKEHITASELQTEQAEVRKLGAERRLICWDDIPIGIVEWLPLNPEDGYPWLGLYMLHSRLHRTGYGAAALRELERLLLATGMTELRLAVLLENEPAHAFWKKQQFNYVSPSVTEDGQAVVIYEKQLERF